MNLEEQDSKKNQEQVTTVDNNIENENTTLDELDKKKRYLSIDLFRGLAIVGMVFVNIISNFDNIPDWSKHTADYGLTYVD